MGSLSLLAGLQEAMAMALERATTVEVAVPRETCIAVGGQYSVLLP